MNRKTLLRLGWGGVVLGLLLIFGEFSGFFVNFTSPQLTATPTVVILAVATDTPTTEPLIPSRTPAAAVATRTPEPLIPTVTSTAIAPPATSTSPSPTEVTSKPPVTFTPTLAAITPSPTTAAMEGDPYVSTWEGVARFGVSVTRGKPQDYDLNALGVGWVMNWNSYAAPPVPSGVEFAQTVRVKGGVLSPAAETLSLIAAANPGALWLIGNEPDVRWQDNITPEIYARLYHAAYWAIKAGDSGAKIAPGGIAQPTPLRFRYLERVLATYESEFGAVLPAQAWHIHNYMLREERDTWGVDIPPGLPDTQGQLYVVEDSGNMDIFRAQIISFRSWMAERGYRNLPLVVSEFGIPMPAEYGFPSERVSEYLRDTWRFFATGTDAGIGLPGDGGRLVQRWCWFSLSDPVYATGNLIELESGSWTPLGRTWISLAR